MSVTAFDRPMRWAQLTLVEDDPGRFNPDFWLDYFRKVKAEGVCLSAGGCVAYYPTKIPLHYRSKWMKDDDPFGYLVQECRKMGMTILARTDPHAVHQDVFDAHPDWIAADREGLPRRHWASPEMWVTCTLGPYCFSFMNEVHEEIVRMYSPDGIFVNRWAGSGKCFCEHCRSSFRSASGFEIPASDDPADPAGRAYIVWQEERLFELWSRWDSAIRAIRPESRLIPNTGGGALSHIDTKRAGEIAPMLVADRQARSGLSAPWANGKNGKEYRSVLGNKPAIGLFSVGIEERYRWKDSVQSEAELRIWTADGIAQGLRPWFCKFSGYLHDERWLGIVEGIYSRHAKMEKYLRNEESLARVAMVYSQRTAAFYGGTDAWRKAEAHILGMYQALVESRVPFEMVHDGNLGADSTGRYRLLILPNIAALSDSQCAEIREFVAHGGSVLATFETSLYDEKGNRRPDFGLADLFGVSFAGITEGPMQNSYLRVRNDEKGGFHPLLAGLENAGRIINGTHRVDVRPNTELPIYPLALIPSYPDLPMEKVYPREPRTNSPGVVVRAAGSGRIVFFPWDVDRTYWEVSAVDHGTLLRNTFRWAAGEEPPVEVSGPGLVDVSVFRQKDSMTVHMVNLTNPFTMKGPYRELIPLSGQKVRLKIPAGKSVAELRFLVSETKPEFLESGGWISAEVPPILDHEILAVDLSG